MTVTTPRFLTLLSSFFLLLPVASVFGLNTNHFLESGNTYQNTVIDPDRLIVENSVQEKHPDKLIFGSSFGNVLGDFLPVDKAFKPMLIPLDGNTIEVSIRVASGYYLYKDKISAEIQSDHVQLSRIELPAGELKSDEYFGEMEVYHKDVFGRLPLIRVTSESIDLHIDLKYQGCADGGICYPPTTRTLNITLPTATAVSALAAVSDRSPPVSEQARLVALISTSNMWVIIATFFGAGLLLAFTPCVLPMVPILSGLIVSEGENVSATRGFLLAFSYVMGMALVYTAAGVVAAAVGLQLQAIFNQPWILTLFSGLFVVLAFGMFGAYNLQMPSFIQDGAARISDNQQRGTIIGAFFMGAVSSLIVTACVAPPLIATLTVIGQGSDMLRAGSALFVLSLGMGTPLLLVGASAGKLIPRAGPWMDAVKNAFGFMMLGLAIWMMSRILPSSVTLALWGVLICMFGIYLGGLTTLTFESGGVQKLGKGLGLLAIIYGAMLLLGSLTGGHSMLQPLSGLGVSEQLNVAKHHKLEFRQIKAVNDLEQALAQASDSGMTVMLDFYADWCVSCIEMEKYTFTDATVQDVLSNTVLLQADVTANDKDDQTLMKRFGVFGPPTIIFFDTDGMQRNEYEVVGYMKAKKFAAHVNLVLDTMD